MAFAVKFRLEFKALQNNGDNTQLEIVWQADISQDGYVGSIIDVDGGSADPITIVLPQFDDIFEPICSSKAVVILMSNTLDEFIEFQTAETYEYIIDIKRDGTTFWKGVYITEPYIEEFVSAPYPVTLNFNDGLAELQYERFEDSGTVRSGFTSVIDIMTKCFSFLPFTRKTRELINIFEDTLDDADSRGLLEQLELFEQFSWEVDKTDDEIKGENCLEVLRGIMSSLKCRLIVSQDIWYVIRIGEMLDNSIKFVEYSTSGVVVSNSTINLRQPITQSASGTALLRHLVGGNNKINREYQEVSFKYSSKNATTLNNNIIINWNFFLGYELESNALVPLHWNRSAAVNTALAADNTGMHLLQTSPQIPQDPNAIITNPHLIVIPSLIFEESLLTNTKIFSNPSHNGTDILAVDALI